MQKLFLTSWFNILLLVLSSFVARGQSFLEVANKQYELQAYNLAVKSYLKVLEKEPENGEALGKLADCYRYLNQMNDAENWYRKAVQQATSEPVNFLNYGKVLMSNGEYDKARQWFNKYAATNPQVGKHYAEYCNFAATNRVLSPVFDVDNEAINTSAADFGPVFYKNKLVYSSARTDLKRVKEKNKADWTGKAFNQLFICDLDANGKPGKPSFLRNDLKNNYNEGPVSFSGNGRWVAYAKNNFVDGTRLALSGAQEMSIYIASVDNDGEWTEAQPFPHNGAGFSCGFPCLNEDGTVLYFSSSRPGGFGGFDIYVSSKRGNTWSAPQNLGNEVNSPGDEITPYYDGANLYFSSDWHFGFGGQDIFMAEQKNGQWGNIMHLGTGVNSTFDDFGFVYNPTRNFGYFVSNRKGKGSEDIYRVTKQTNNITITVLDESGKKPLEGASVDFGACDEGALTTDKFGRCSFQAMKGLDCNVKVSLDGYAPGSLKVTLSGTGQSRSFEVKLKSIATAAAPPKETPDNKARSRSAEVNEEPQTPGSSGMVKDAETGTGIASVSVRAVSQTDGSKIETYTDNSGGYLLELKANQSYIIRFSKAGYSDINRTYKTKDKLPADLGTLQLKSTASSAVAKTTPAQPPAAKKSLDQPAAGKPEKTTAKATEAKQPATAKTAEKTRTAPPADLGMMESGTAKGLSGFAIQLAAGKNVDMKQYQALTAIGSLYLIRTEGISRIRMGTFATKEEAVSMLGKVKAAGYTNAYIVTEKPDEEDASAKKTTETPAAKPAPKPPVAKPAAAYKVRLAAVRDTKNFDDKPFKGMGVIEEEKNGPWTILFLSGFSTKQQALDAAKKAGKLGFPQAYAVVMEQNKYKKIE